LSFVTSVVECLANYTVSSQATGRPVSVLLGCVVAWLVCLEQALSITPSSEAMGGGQRGWVFSTAGKNLGSWQFIGFAGSLAEGASPLRTVGIELSIIPSSEAVGQVANFNLTLLKAAFRGGG